MKTKELAGKTMLAAVAALAIGTATAKEPQKMIWAQLVHLSTNMWNDDPPENYQTFYRKIRALSPKLLFDRTVWNRWVDRMVEAKMNMVVIDVGDGVRYDSHPELALEGSWTKEELRAELARLRKLGLEPIPKLNFSARHDSWLKVYHRMLSTPKYYEVCADLIREISEIFDKPRFLHIGMDEETPSKDGEMSVVRMGKLWWHDFLFLCGEVEKNGMRPWIWYYNAYEEGEKFFELCPKSVVVSTAEYYFGAVNDDNPKMKWLRKLDEHGYDVIPCGSNWACPENMRELVSWGVDNVSEEHLKGFIMAPWVRTLPCFRKQGLRSITCVEDAIDMYESRNDGERRASAVWFVKDGEKSAYRTNFPEDRLQYFTGDQLVVDFGMKRPMRPVLELQHSYQNIPCTITVQAANKLDGQRAVPEGETVSYVLKEGEYRVETDKVLGPARYLVITADRKFFLTGLSVKGE